MNKRCSRRYQTRDGDRRCCNHAVEGSAFCEEHAIDPRSGEWTVAVLRNGWRRWSMIAILDGVVMEVLAGFQGEEEAKAAAASLRAIIASLGGHLVGDSAHDPLGAGRRLAGPGSRSDDRW